MTHKEIAEGVLIGVLTTAAEMGRGCPESLGEYEHEVAITRDGSYVIVGDKKFAISIEVKEVDAP